MPPPAHDPDQLTSSIGDNTELLKLASNFTSNARPLEFGYFGNIPTKKQQACETVKTN